MKKSKETLVLGIAVVIFLWFGYYAIASGVTDYVNDAIVSIVVVGVLYKGRKKLGLSAGGLAGVAIAFIFHDLGVFGFYNQSPVVMQWDHITHIIGSAAFMGVVWQYMKRFVGGEKFQNGMLYGIMVLTVLGIGVIIEFYEFTGFFIVGEGMGGLGHGLGDIVTELGNSEWFNTMFDMIYNVIGAGAALAVIMVGRKWKKDEG